MKCIWLIIVVFTTVGLEVLARPDVSEIVESPVETSATIDQNDDSPDTAKSSDPDTFDDETEMEMNDLEKRLPSGYETVRDNVVDSEFDCKERETGFYADTENECQIFHRCSNDQVFSFYCPEGTVFSQRDLVCVWNGTKDFDCSESENYYEESNRAFFGNFTAMENIRENMKISAEIPINKKADVEVIKSEIHDTETSKSSNESSEMLEKNSIEENIKSVTNEDLSVADSGDYHSDAEFLPHVLSGPDASIASSESNSELDNVKSPQKIIVSVLDPIIEMPSIEEVDEQTRNHRKRSNNNIHRRRFLFKADTTN